MDNKKRVTSQRLYSSSPQYRQMRMKGQTSCSFSLNPLSLHWLAGLLLLLCGSPLPHLLKALQVLQLLGPSFSQNTTCTMAWWQWEREAGSSSFVLQKVSMGLWGWGSHPCIGTEGWQVEQVFLSWSAGTHFCPFQASESLGKGGSGRVLTGSHAFDLSTVHSAWRHSAKFYLLGLCWWSGPAPTSFAAVHPFANPSLLPQHSVVLLRLELMEKEEGSRN